MTYSIGQVAEMFHLSVSSLRFYDREGLLINLERDSAGIRKFNESNLEAIRLIECLKKAGMQIKEIKEFMQWVELGDSTISKRKEMFLKQKENIEREIQGLNKALDMIKFKCWYYDEAMKDNNELRVKNMPLTEMPEEIKVAYEGSH